MSIKQARLIVNAHKYNLLNSFCNNWYVYDKQLENNNNNNKNQERERVNMPVTVQLNLSFQNDQTGQ